MKYAYRLFHGLLIAIAAQLVVTAFDERTAIIFLAMMIGILSERTGEKERET